MCGGRLAVLAGDKPKKDEPATGGVSHKRWDKQLDKSKPREGEDGEKLTLKTRSEAFDTLKQASPLSIFVADILTLGLRSILWLWGRMPSLEDMARRDENPRKSALFLCFAAYTALLALITIACRELYLAGWDFSTIGRSIFPRAALGALIILFLASRHNLFWTREVIADAIQREDADTIHTKAEFFAPSPFLLWFIGVPYLQFHLNEILRARNLANFKSSKRRPS
jgi:hypothetical protein